MSPTPGKKLKLAHIRVFWDEFHNHFAIHSIFSAPSHRQEDGWEHFARFTPSQATLLGVAKAFRHVADILEDRYKKFND